jgi:hypothetical protein
MTLRTAQPRARRRWLVLLMSVVLLLGSVAGAAFAILKDGSFELDRNATSDAAVAGDDWDKIDDGPTDPSSDDSANASSWVADGNGPTIFTQGGSKDDLNTTGWRHKDGSSPDKDELLHAFAARYDDNLYFGADRFSNSGDAVMGFWFFQQEITAQPDGTFGPGVHEDGDVLVLSDFTGGGGNVTIRVYQWNGPGGSNTTPATINGTLDLIAGTLASPADCVGPPATANDFPYCATVNTTNTDSPWAFQAKASGSPANVFPAGHFFEGGIDLGFLDLGEECFASFLAETRASTSVDSILKDFVGGVFERCTSSVVTTPSNAAGVATPTIEKGGDIYDKAVVSGTGSSNTPGGTVDFWLCSPSQLDDPAVPVAGDDPATCDIGGTKITDDAAVGAGGVAMSTVANPGSTGKWCWRGEYSGDGNFPAATDASTGECFNVVDAKISVTPLVATNETGEDHVVTATVQQDTGSGFVSAPNGTTVTFSLPNNLASAAFKPAGVNTCTTTSGTCSVTITTTATGTVDIHATSTFSILGLSVTRATGGTGNSVDANKRYVDAQIDLDPLTDTNGISENHVITATVQQDDGLAASTGGGDLVTGFGPAPVGTTVTFNIATGTATFVPAGVNTCTTGAAGTCSITIVSSTVGTVTVHATTTFDIGPAEIESVTRATGTGGNNSADASKTFVAGSLAWIKNGNAGARLAGATFSVCRTADRFGNAIDNTVEPCISVTDGSAPDTDTDGGEFLLANLKLGHYTVVETAAPAGYVLDGSTKSADLTLAAPNASIAIAFVNGREILKISGFGYTNDAVGTPTAGVTTGVTTFSVNLHNYGSTAATLSNSSIVITVSGIGAGTVTCNGDGAAPARTKAITGTVAAGGDLGPITITCNYVGVADGAVITATLNINSTTNGLERPASGSPATISFTVQGN